jgi:hypothetical protein
MFDVRTVGLLTTLDALAQVFPAVFSLRPNVTLMLWLVFVFKAVSWILSDPDPGP